MSSASPLKLYIAGKWGDRAHIADVMQLFIGNKYQITHDWTAVEEEDKKSVENLQAFAESDIEGVCSADCLIIIITDKNYEYRGTCTEMGAALALNKKVFVVGSSGSKFATNIFINHVLVKCVDTVNDVFTELRVICDKCDGVAGRYEVCVDCEKVICHRCDPPGYRFINDWCELDNHCCKCNKMVCESCAVYCYHCASEDSPKTYCDSCEPESYDEIECESGIHLNYTCGKHEDLICLECKYDI